MIPQDPEELNGVNALFGPRGTMYWEKKIGHA
jgi:hypothetical protein